jgi:hypothetical protein
MSENEKNDDVIPDHVENFGTEASSDPVIEESFNPKNPKRPLLFGERFAQNVRRREDRNKSPIGQRIDKLSRRYWRKQMMMRTRVSGTYPIGCDLEGKMIYQTAVELKEISIDMQLMRERVVQNETGKLATNSHERARAIEEDSACRRATRKEIIGQDHLKRSTAGELLRPLGVQPTRSQRKAEHKLMRKAAKLEIRARQLEARMYGAIGAPSIVSSPTTTEESAPT